MACDALFSKHYNTCVIHFGILHFKNEETLFYSVGPISRYSRSMIIIAIWVGLGWVRLGGGGEAEQLSGVNDSFHIFFNNLTSKFQK